MQYFVSILCFSPSINPERENQFTCTQISVCLKNLFVQDITKKTETRWRYCRSRQIDKVAKFNKKLYDIIAKCKNTICRFTIFTVRSSIPEKNSRRKAHNKNIYSPTNPLGSFEGYIWEFNLTDSFI